jgi:murein DD-endopeptidase MepM/ murein hydrolase activator NlpD
MERTRRPALYALVVLLLLGLIEPAGAETAGSARRRQAATRARRARVAAQIDTLRASDAELERAVRALDTQVVAQVARADAARQAVQAADAALADAESRLRATQQELETRRRAVINRAVFSYVNPYGGLVGEVVTAKNLAEASRKQELLEFVTGGDRVLVDRLRATEDDLTVLQGQLSKAREDAHRRRAQVVKRLTELRSTRGHQARLRSALDARIREFVAEADLLAAQEASLVAYIRRREAEDVGGGGVVSGAGLIWPVRGRITSGFGMRWGRMHTGIDIAAGSGTAIHAARGGTVIASGWQGGYGNVVIVSHGGGMSTLYAHQSRRAASDGQRVSQGDVIGYVGSTGHSTGPHLHFEVRIGGSPVNPRRYLA